jgi:hypothetical protein
MRKPMCRKYSIRPTVLRKRLVEEVAGGGEVDEKAHVVVRRDADDAAFVARATKRGILAHVHSGLQRRERHHSSTTFLVFIRNL